MKYLFVFLLLFIPAVITGINGQYDLSAIFLTTIGIITFFEKRKDLIDKYF